MGETTVVDTMSGALTTGLTSIASDIGTAIGNIIPIALPIMGGILLVAIGIRVFKRFTGR